MGYDYGRGLSNVDHETGIRYGIIPSNELAYWIHGNFELPDILICPECNAEILPDDSRWKEENDDGETECPECGTLVYSERFGEWTEYYDGPLYYNDDKYSLMMDSSGDVWVFKSPYKVKAGYCSPCAPGAIYLLDRSGDNYGYALGHDWFENGIIPYHWPLQEIRGIK